MKINSPRQAVRDQAEVRAKATLVLKVKALLHQLKALQGKATATGAPLAGRAGLLAALDHLLDEDALIGLLDELQRVLKEMEGKLTADSYAAAMNTLQRAQALVPARMANHREAGGMSVRF